MKPVHKLAITAIAALLTVAPIFGQDTADVPKAPELPATTPECKEITSFDALREWAASDIRFGKLARTFTYDGKGKVTVPTTHSLHRTAPWAHIDCGNQHSILEWNGPLSPANVGTSLLFRNSVPAYVSPRLRHRGL